MTLSVETLMSSLEGCANCVKRMLKSSVASAEETLAPAESAAQICGIFSQIFKKSSFLKGLLKPSAIWDLLGR